MYHKEIHNPVRKQGSTRQQHLGYSNKGFHSSIILSKSCYMASTTNLPQVKAESDRTFQELHLQGREETTGKFCPNISRSWYSDAHGQSATMKTNKLTKALNIATKIRTTALRSCFHRIPLRYLLPLKLKRLAQFFKLAFKIFLLYLEGYTHMAIHKMWEMKDQFPKLVSESQ